MNADKGISFASSGTYRVYGNVLKNVGGLQNLIMTSPGTTVSDYNFYDPVARIGVASMTPSPLAQAQAAGYDLHSRQGSSLLDANYKPQAGSPMIDSSIRQVVYDRFFQYYGIDIAKDLAGIPRPQGAGWDIGAYEYSTGAASAGGPSVPTGIQVR